MPAEQATPGPQQPMATTQPANRRLTPSRVVQGLARRALQLAHRTRGRLRRGRKRALRTGWGLVYGRRAPSFARSLELVRTRDQIPELLNRRGLIGVGVEIGVKRGRYSEFLLHRWRGRRLISVDPWLEAPSDEYVDRANVPQERQERYFRETTERLARFGERSEIWRTTSAEAAARVEDSSLDFVYVDARHDRESVLEDLEAWYPKLRPGGIIAGHDYVDGSFPNGEFGVRSAVDTFFGRLGFPVNSTRGRPAAVEVFPSWIVSVPDE